MKTTNRIGDSKMNAETRNGLSPSNPSGGEAALTVHCVVAVEGSQIRRQIQQRDKMNGRIATLPSSAALMLESRSNGNIGNGGSQPIGHFGESNGHLSLNKLADEEKKRNSLGRFLFGFQWPKSRRKPKVSTTPRSTTPSRATLRRDPSRQTIATGGVGNMCGIAQSGICHFTEITPGQFGLTKQLVLRITLPHISLLLISIGYALAGCWILTAINYKTDSLEAEQLIDEYTVQLVEMIRSTKDFTQNPNQTHGFDIRRTNAEFSVFAAELFEIYGRFPRSPAVSNKAKVEGHRFARGPLTNVTWNLFFVATTLTSIGYGTNAPDSLVGRLFCIIYISFGIPLYLITLADMAKFCTEFMNRSYTEYLKAKHKLKSRFKRWRKQRKEKRRSTPPPEGESPTLDSVDRVIIAGGEDEVAEFLWTHLENTQFVEIPFVLIYIILLTYIGLASYYIAYLEDWSTQDGFYFVMMSVLTIGFGDVMPYQDRNVLAVLGLILTGLIITTTCIDIVGAYYIDQLHFFGRRLDTEDPLLWLKAVQQKRIDAMKREAMRKLFETVAALNRMRFEGALNAALPPIISEETVRIMEGPDPPRNVTAFSATAESVCLRWEPPIFVDEGKRYWYTISYKTRTPQRRQTVTVIDFISQTQFEVGNLKSFTLYEFSVQTTTRFGSSKAVRCQEYTEPCTVPQSVKLEAVSTETATISWRPPRKNIDIENYVVIFTAEPEPPFRYWRRFRAGKSHRFTLSGLSADTRYVCSVIAEHNFGMAAISKPIRFQTPTWLGDYESEGEELSAENVAIIEELMAAEGRRMSRRRVSEAIAWAQQQQQFASRTPTPTPMWRPKPWEFPAPPPTPPFQMALNSQTHFLASPQRRSVRTSATTTPARSRQPSGLFSSPHSSNAPQ